MNPKITAMVAIYNGEKYLPQCLDSLIRQSFTNFEALLIDDGSTDKSLEICTKYVSQDSRFRLIKFKKNRGLTYARHVGLKEARGEYVAILDADDISLPKRFAWQASYLASHPETVLLGGYYGIITEAGKIKRRCKRVPLSDLEIRWRLTFGNCLIHSTVMYRKQAAIDCGGYDLAILHGEDIELHAKLLAAGKVAAIPKNLCLWRTHQQSMTKQFAQDNLDKYYFLVVQRTMQSLVKKNIPFEVAAAIYFNTKNPAGDSSFLIHGLTILKEIYEFYSNNFANTKREIDLLSKMFMIHLLKIRKRNFQMKWWRELVPFWQELKQYLIVDKKYHWIRDFINQFPHCQFSLADLAVLGKKK